MGPLSATKEPAISHGPPSTEQPATLWALVSTGLSRNPSGVAVNSVHQEIQHTYTQLNKDSESLARAWHQRGITGAVLVLLPNCAEFSTILWAAARLGVEFSPVNPKSNHDLVKHYIHVLQPEVIVVEDEGTLDELDNANILPPNLKLRLFVRPGEARKAGNASHSLQAMISEGLSSSRPLPSPVTDVRTPAVVIWTSGTTSLPKACPQTGETLSAAVATYTAWRRPSTDRSMLCHIPAFHVYAVIYSILFWSVGGSVVVPSPNFDPVASLNTLERGLVTDVPMIPAMFRMITTHRNYDRTKIKNVRAVSMGGSLIPTETIQSAGEAFSAKANGAFGMSEAMGILGWHDSESFVTEAGFVSVGKAGYGVHVKICGSYATSTDPLVRGETGELHVAGPSVIDAYRGNVSPDSFYMDSDGLRWLKTGDQARMSDEGAVFILGRYKDMIIRGGENIAPAAIETILNSFSSIEGQVVGVPDDILAGEELICAVLKVKNNAECPALGAMQEAIRKKLGPMYLLSKVMTLQDLDLGDFPTTPTNKVRKDELRRLVRESIMDQPGMPQGSASEVESTVLEIWSDLLATPKQELDRHLPIEQLADSLTLARVRGMIKRKLGKDVPDALLKCQGGIAQQIDVISKSSTNSTSIEASQSRRETPPNIEDIILARGSSDVYASMKDHMDGLTSPLKMSWQDVEEILPTPPSSAYMLSNLSNHFVILKYSLWATDISPDELCQAFQHFISSWDSTRLLFARPGKGEPFYAQMKATSQWFDQVLAHLDRPVADEKELKELTRHIEDIYIQPPQPLFKVHFVPVKSKSVKPNTTSSAAIIIAQHAIFDAFTTSFWLEDLRGFLQDRTYRPDRLPYKEFANMLYDTAGSARADASIRFWQEQYTGISEFADCTWPPQRAPGYFIGSDAGSTDQTARQDLHLDSDHGLTGLEGIRASIALPSLSRLRHVHAIHPVILIKSAYALFIAFQTGKSAAMFGTVQGGRQWPFQPPSVEHALPSAMAVAGPTFSFVVDVVPVDPAQSALDFMKAMVAQQDLDVKHMHAPLPAIHSRLAPEDSKVLRTAHSPSKFNWRPNMPSEAAEAKEKLKVVVSDLYLGTGALMNFRQRDGEPEKVYAQAQYDDCHIGKEELERAVEKIFRAADWMCREENWGRGVGECLREVLGEKSDGRRDSVQQLG